MTIEELVEQFNTEKNVIRDSIQRLDKIIAEISAAGDEQYDWISVKKAAALVDVSPVIIYNKINKGLLRSKHINSKTFVMRSEVVAIDDKCR